MKLITGDALEILRTLTPDSVDSIVTDPPAGISFMGKEWDHHKGGRDEWVKWMQAIASECLRVLKPGGHALVWALPRTSHWTATAWENAGFEVRDRIGHIFGSGFPKSLDISKAIDKEAKAEREMGKPKVTPTGRMFALEPSQGKSSGYSGQLNVNRYEEIPATELAQKWFGWGTALKPAVEDWWLLRKPLSEKTVAANVLKWGTGAINVDGCRVGLEGTLRPNGPIGYNAGGSGGTGGSVSGRFPAHLIHDGSEEVMDVFPEQNSGGTPKRRLSRKTLNVYGDFTKGNENPDGIKGSSGSAARFFYTAKASRRERERGLKGMNQRKRDQGRRDGNPGGDNPRNRGVHEVTNHHPTVKPLALMEYLVRLITPPNGIVLDCFCGSGTTAIACIREGFDFIGIDSDTEYIEIARRRVARWLKDPTQLSLIPTRP